MNKIFLELERLIKMKEFKPGEPLPLVNDLAKKFNINKEEVKKAISELIYECELERIRPEPLDTVYIPNYKLWGTLTGHHSITNEARKRGQEPGVKIIKWELLESWPVIQSRLALKPGDKVQIMERLRTVNDKPIAIETSYFPAKYYPGITPDLFAEKGSGQSSFIVMEKKFGLVSERAIDELTVVCLEKREADYLELNPGTPVLLRFRVTLSDKDIPIKASRALWKFRAGYEMSLKNN